MSRERTLSNAGCMNPKQQLVHVVHFRCAAVVHPRYPRFPQARAAWLDSVAVTALRSAQAMRHRWETGRWINDLPGPGECLRRVRSDERNRRRHVRGPDRLRCGDLERSVRSRTRRPSLSTASAVRAEAQDRATPGARDRPGHPGSATPTGRAATATGDAPWRPLPTATGRILPLQPRPARHPAPLCGDRRHGGRQRCRPPFASCGTVRGRVLDPNRRTPMVLQRPRLHSPHMLSDAV